MAWAMLTRCPEGRYVRSPALPVEVHHLRKGLVPFSCHLLALEMHEVELSEMRKATPLPSQAGGPPILHPFPPSGLTLRVLFLFLGGCCTR